MLVPKDIEDLVRTQHRVIVSRHPGSNEALRCYKNRGGSGPHWFVAGIYAHSNLGKRLVLEALHLERFDACVVRVFQEDPLSFLYERKAVHDISACSRKVTEAAEHFQLHLPEPLLRLNEHDNDVWPEVDRAMLPVPPPVLFWDIPE